MPIITTQDGTELDVKEWGAGRPMVLIHGWPLNADMWDTPRLRRSLRHHQFPPGPEGLRQAENLIAFANG